MKASLPFLARVCLVSLVGHAVSGQTAPERGTGSEGDRLIGRALDAVRSHSSITAAIRQKAEVAGYRLFGEGRYLQLGRGEAMRVRLELKIQIGDQVTNMLRLTDGRYLWMNRQEGAQSRMDRVDLARIRAAQKATDDRAAFSTELPLTGGLPDLLAALSTCFQFAAPKASRLGELPTYSLLGHWRPPELASLLPDMTDIDNLRRPAVLDRLPAQIPYEVLLTLGREDLFPHVVEYRRGRTAPAGQGRGDPEGPGPLLRMELFEVRINAPIDPRQFVCQLGDVEPVDDTQRYLDRLRRR